MVKLSGTFSSIQPFQALVLGDFMLDTYTTGRVKRVSPEAPVLVMEVQNLESRPGGAGNVVLNLVTLGARVVAVGRTGADREGDELRGRLGREGVDVSGLVIEPTSKTPVKNRLIADSQQLLRVDLETIAPLGAELERSVVAFLEQMIPTVQVVAVSDYGKGFLTQGVLSAAIRIARDCKIPIIIDPKGIDFVKYKGANVLKPNLSEAYAAAKLPQSAPLDAVAKELLRISEVDLVLITRSEAGMSIFSKEGKRTDFPVRSKEVKDVTGAGDTVLSMISLGLANGIDITVAAQLANIAAGISIERLGCAQVTLSEIARRLLEFDADTKIFDESHTYALRQVLKGKKYSLLVLNQGQGMTNSLFRTIRELSNKKESELIIYVRGSNPNDEFVHLLSSLNEVDFIVLETESLKHLCETIHPHEVFYLEDNQLVQAQELISALLNPNYPTT
jgi:D-beta-D-heptose 7-phosphate kinase/D-beta-D-heptose 1-phosphate adenosyltransferase